MKSIRVCHLITELGQGGAQHALCRFLTAADRERYEHSVLCLYNGSTPIADAIRRLGVEVTDLGIGNKMRMDRMGQLPAAIRKAHPHVLHGWMYHGNVASRIAGRLAHVSIVITSRRNEHIGGGFREWLKRKTARMDDRVIAVSNVVREAEIERAGAQPEHVVTIYNGVDTSVTVDRAKQHAALRAEFGMPAETQVIVTVGRLHPQKGHESLLKAFARLREEGCGARLLIVGDGSLREQLESYARNLDLADVVTFTGPRADAAELVAGSDVLALASRWEGMPNAVLEAMLVGTPVVATRVGGVPELLDEESGVVVPPCDIDAMAAALARALSDAAWAASLVEHAHKRVKECFTIAQTVQNTEALYSELLREKLGMTYGTTEWTVS